MAKKYLLHYSEQIYVMKKIHGGRNPPGGLLGNPAIQCMSMESKTNDPYAVPTKNTRTHTVTTWRSISRYNYSIAEIYCLLKWDLIEMIYLLQMHLSLNSNLKKLLKIYFHAWRPRSHLLLRSPSPEKREELPCPWTLHRRQRPEVRVREVINTYQASDGEEVEVHMHNLTPFERELVASQTLTDKELK